MRFLLFCTILFQVACNVTLRRLRKGPAQPNWTWRTECILTLLQTYRRRGRGKSIAQMRRGIPEAPMPPHLKQRIDRKRVTLGGQPCERFTPKQQTPDAPILLYLHGGAYCMGSSGTHRMLIARICWASKATVYALNYRLAPEHPYPCAIEDAVAAVLQLQQEGVQPGRLFIAGDSAGGGLTLATLQTLREQKNPLPSAAVLLSPWVDLTLSGESIDPHAPFDYVVRPALKNLAANYADPQEHKSPLVSPMFADLAGLPPMLVQTGGAEALYSENCTLVERAQAAGVDVTHEVTDEMFHVWQAFAFAIAEGRTAIASLGRFIQDHHQPWLDAQAAPPAPDHPGEHDGHPQSDAPRTGAPL